MDTDKKGLVPKLRFLPEFRDYWHILELGKCFKNIGGTALEKYVKDDGTHHFISIGNYSTDGKYIDKGQRVEANEITKAKLLNKNDLVMVLNDKTLVGDIIGSTLLIDQDNKYIYNQRSERLIVNSELLPIFTWHLLNSPVVRQEVFKRSQGGTQIYVNFPTIRAIKLSFPKEQKEQKKIADCLSSIDDLITAQSQKLDTLKAHKKGLMQQLFPAQGETTPKLRFPEFRDAGDWEEKKIEELAKRGSGHTPNRKKASYYNGGIKWVSLADSNMLDNGYIYKTKNEISKEGLNNSSAKLHPPGTVILSRDAGVGKSAILHSEMAVSQHFIAWACDHSMLSNWFLYYLLQILKPTFERIAVGNTIKTIGLPFFKELCIPIPSFPEQQKIADCLSSVDDLITAQTQKLDTLKAHKKGLMQQLFPSIAEVNE